MSKRHEEIKQAVREVLDERDAERLHSQAHKQLFTRLSDKANFLPEGKTVMARCGICERIFQQAGGQIQATEVSKTRNKL